MAEELRHLSRYEYQFRAYKPPIYVIFVLYLFGHVTFAVGQAHQGERVSKV